jgi:hypothetical protein
MLGVSLRVDFYMTQEDQDFIANVVVIDPMREMVASSVISRPTGVIAKLNAIVKIHKHRGRHEGHHFIPMAMKCMVHPSVI